MRGGWVGIPPLRQASCMQMTSKRDTSGAWPMVDLRRDGFTALETASPSRRSCSPYCDGAEEPSIFCLPHTTLLYTPQTTLTHLRTLSHLPVHANAESLIPAHHCHPNTTSHHPPQSLSPYPQPSSRVVVLHGSWSPPTFSHAPSAICPRPPIAFLTSPPQLLVRFLSP